MTTASITTILDPSHLVGNVLLIASKISCASLLTDLFFRAAASWRRATAALARDNRMVGERGVRGGLALAKALGTRGRAERRVKFCITDIGMI